MSDFYIRNDSKGDIGSLGPGQLALVTSYHGMHRCKEVPNLKLPHDVLTPISLGDGMMDFVRQLQLECPVVKKEIVADYPLDSSVNVSMVRDMVQFAKQIGLEVTLQPQPMSFSVRCTFRLRK